MAYLPYLSPRFFFLNYNSNKFSKFYPVSQIEHPPQPPVVIFDGVCELCNRTVDFIIKRERKPYFYFTANQNPPGRKILQDFGVDPDKNNTIYLFENGKLYHRSTAALRIARKLSFPWMLLYAFIILPTFLRNWVYNFIAKRRYRWFGKRDTCRIPSEEEIARFLLE